MSDKKQLFVNGFKFPVFPMIVGIVGYFVYGSSIDAGLGIFLLDWVSGAVSLFGFIPVIGVVITHFAWGGLFGVVAAWSGIYPTWLTTLIYIMTMVFSVIFTCITIALGILAIKSHRGA